MTEENHKKHPDNRSSDLGAVQRFTQVFSGGRVSHQSTIMQRILMQPLPGFRIVRLIRRKKEDEN